MKRVLTAAVVIPILLYTVWSSSPYFFVILATLAVLTGLSEFYRMALLNGHRVYAVIGYAGAITVTACFAFGRPAWIAAIAALMVILTLAQSLLRPEELKTAAASASVTVFGVLYIAVLVGFLVGVRTAEFDRIDSLPAKLLTLFFALVMMTDTGAYYVGRAIGKRKLAPAISPGKTVEGAIGGFITAAATGPACKYIFFPEIPLGDAIVLGVIIGIVGQIGDLAESLLKRGSGVKDSSNLFPGHGGMLDRLDSILFSAPVLYAYLNLVISRR